MTDWLSAAAMLLSGLVIGFMILYSMKWSKGATAAAADRVLARRDLEAKRDALVAQMREMPDGDPDRPRLESETAAVLRQLDAGGAQTPSPASSTAQVAPSVHTKQPSAFKGFAWGVLTAAMVGGVLYYVMQSAKPRGENEPTTGAAMPAATQQQQPPQSDAVLKGLEAQVAKSPDDLELRNQLAKAYFDRENLMAVFEQTEFILKKTPNDARALTYQALVRMSMGQNDDAQRMLETATKNDPKLVDSFVALAWLYMLRNRPADAEATMKVAMTNHPDQQARLTDVLAQMHAKAASRNAQSAAAAPAATAASATAPAAAEGPVVHVSLSLAGGATPPANATIFVYARAAGVTSGPPAAVKRLPLAPFPLSFDLTGADSMMGQPLPPSMRIEARIDSDGNAMTKSPADLTAAQDNVSSGATVSLTLK